MQVRGDMRKTKEQLSSAVIGDILDTMGRLRQFLPSYLRPISEGTRLFGRAFTVLESDFVRGDQDQGSNPVLKRPFGLMLEAVDNLSEGEVYLCSGSSPTYALWGELMSVRAKTLGAAGAVVDGFHRDTFGIREQEFPVFSMGPWSQDQAPRGAVIDYQVAIQFGCVLIRPGDLIYGDFDGVIVIPAEIESEVVELALDKASKENLVAKALQDGMSAEEAFNKFGVM